MVKGVFNLFVLAVLTFSSFASFATTKVTASVDRNPAMLNESIILEVVADDSLANNSFDSSNLMKSFMVGSTSVSSQTQIINGSMSRSTKWTTVLIPTKVGEFTIPSFTIDGVASNPIQLQVIQPSQSSTTQANQELFVETSVDKEEVFIQQMINYTVKLFIAADLQSGSLTEPTLAGAAIKQIGKDKESTEIVNGKRYRVIERIYAITPSQSGEFTIAAPVFSGEVIANNRRRSFFSSFSQTKPISRVGNEISISVNPIPANFNGSWLPSEFVAINEEWQPNDSEFNVGDPITRTITFTAIGVDESQLPEIEMPLPTEFKVYPDQAALNTVNRNDKIISQRVSSFAIVPNNPGKFTLPEISIPWFNTVTKRIEYAKLPEKEITITGVAKINESINLPAPVQSNENSNSTLPSSQVNIPSLLTDNASTNNLMLVIYGLSGLWVLTLIIWWLHVRAIAKRVIGQEPAHSHSGNSSGKSYLKQAQQAGKSNDAHLFNQSLLKWLACIHVPTQFNNISEIQSFFDNDALTQELSLLQKALYSKSQDITWSSAKILKLCQSLPHTQSLADTPQLQPLNP